VAILLFSTSNLISTDPLCYVYEEIPLLGPPAIYSVYFISGESKRAAG